MRVRSRALTRTVLLAAMYAGVPAGAVGLRAGHGAAGSAPSDLARSLELAAATSPAEVAKQLQGAIDQAKSGDLASAMASFDRVIARYPGVADWAHALAAQAAARTGDTATVRRRLEATSAEIAAEWGWRVRMDAFRNAGDLPAAIVVAEQAAGAMANADRAAAVWGAAADARFARRDSAGARAALRRVLELAPLSSAGQEAAGRLAEMRGATPDEQLTAARSLLAGGSPSRAVSALRRYLSQPGAAASKDVQLDLGIALLRSGRLAEASRVLTQLSKDSPAAIAASALYFAGRATFRQGSQEGARATWARMAEQYPSEEVTASALFAIADLAHDAGRIEEAERYYQQQVTLHPRSDESAQAFMRLGGIQFTRGDYAAAARTFDAFRDVAGSTAAKQQAAYWSGRAHLAGGQGPLAKTRFAEAIQHDPFSYYAVLAGDRLGQPFAPRVAVAPASAATVLAQASGGVHRIALLRALNLPQAEAVELESQKRHFATMVTGLQALAEAFQKEGRTIDAVRIGRDLVRRGDPWDDRILRIIYPLNYRELIETEAVRNAVQPHLLAGLIRQESLFDPGAVSRAGAIGLMQIMPATGRQLAARTKSGTVTTTRLKQPALNLRLGAAYVAELYGRNGERIEDLLAAYNAGPSRLARWRSHAEYADNELFVERIPFAETREYVKAVAYNQRMYAVLYADSRASPLPGTDP